MKCLIPTAWCLAASLFFTGCAQKPAPVEGSEERPSLPAEGGTADKASKVVQALSAESTSPRPKVRYEERLTKLLAAAEKGQVSHALEAIAEGANVNDKDEAGETALMKAASNCHA